MHYRLLFPLPISLIFFQCSSSSSSVPFAASQYWQLSEQEKVTVIEPAILDFYEEITPIPRAEVPLSKYIESPDYQVYISIFIEQFSSKNADQLTKSNDQVGIFLQRDAVATNETTLHQYLRRLPDRRFVVSSIYNTPSEKIPVMINVVTSDSLQVYREFWGQSFIEQKLSLH